MSTFQKWLVILGFFFALVYGFTHRFKLEDKFMVDSFTGKFWRYNGIELQRMRKSGSLFFIEDREKFLKEKETP